MTSSLIFSFAICFLALKLTIKLSSKISNPTRDFVPGDKEIKKKVSPFGGICMFFAIFISILIFAPKMFFVFVPSFLMLLLGMVDDLKKVISGNYKGISAKQKLLFQSLIGATVCFLGFYFNPNFDTFKIVIPFYGFFELKTPLILSFIIAFFAFNGTVNAANLTDGLDGLAGKQVLAIFSFLLAMLFVLKAQTEFKIFALIIIGSLLAFLIFNSNPASIFMGDAGSMGLGSLIATFFIIFKMELIMPFVCFVIFMEALSVILQVVYFKKTGGKRIFKMSPLHHHFQLSGMKEQKITELAFLITIVLSLIFLTPFF
jgi:phospho-N-acetylmuramoyl-pentapeptide-transferase